MKKLLKLLVIVPLVTLSTVVNAWSFEQYLTIKFKKPVSEQFLQELKKMTNTDVEKVLNSDMYKVEIKAPTSNMTLERYSELFSIMLNVESVSPLPKEKISDKLTPTFYINNRIKTEKDIKTDEASRTPETQLVPDEMIVKFNSGVSSDDIQSLNDKFGGNVTYDKDSSSYKVKIPEKADYDYAKNFYEYSGLVESVEQAKRAPETTETTPSPETTPTKTASNNQQGVMITVPLSKTSVKVTFKIGEGETGFEWLNKNFGAQLVSKSGFNTYLLRFPSNVNPKIVARALKACSAVSMAQAVSK